MTPEQIQQMADGLPPSQIGMDHEEVITHLAEKHIQLQQQVNELAADNAAMKSAIEQTIGWMESVDPDNEESVRLLIDLKTPATDAAIRELQAQGVEIAINKLKALDADGFAVHSLECKLNELRNEGGV